MIWGHDMGGVIWSPTMKGQKNIEKQNTVHWLIQGSKKGPLIWAGIWLGRLEIRQSQALISFVSWRKKMQRVEFSLSWRVPTALEARLRVGCDIKALTKCFPSLSVCLDAASMLEKTDHAYGSELGTSKFMPVLIAQGWEAIFTGISAYSCPVKINLIWSEINVRTSSKQDLNCHW